MSARALNLLVFRPGRKRAAGEELKAGLLRSIESARLDLSSENILGALLRAGELECAISDAPRAESSQPLFSLLTDALADALLCKGLSPHLPQVIEAISKAPVPELLELSRPEGFAYYALHPVAYARVLDQLAGLPEHLVVIGIRSIGTTLSAMAAAAARLRHVPVSRITVRPGGHPYNRETQFTAEQSLAIGDAISRCADFLIVDEGPGLSGSSFLSVAEALERTGVAAAKITMICGHQPNPDGLCSNNAAERWRRYRSVAAAPDPQRPAGTEVFVGTGEWRKLLFESSCRWPESWIGMERLKYLSAGEPPRLFKFAGLAHYGDPVIEREQAVAERGFGPALQRESDGFVSYPWIEGRPGSARDLSSSVLARLAEYCAFRASAFSADDADLGAVQEMAEHNLAQLGQNIPVSLKVERPVIVDGRMQPHEWVFTTSGQMLKTDSGSHGDDHFFPGPTDMAWDLAGAIVEWRMGAQPASSFLERYHAASGDDAVPRIEDFVRAYTAFRWAYCTMAANAMHGTPEHERLNAAAAYYAARLQTLEVGAISASVAR